MATPVAHQLEIADVLTTGIRIVLNPDKLEHLTAGAG